MPQQELLKKITKVFEETGIQYMITGSVASSFQGEPRTTHNIDIIVSIPIDAIERLLQEFPPPDFYLDKNNIMAVLNNKSGMFNLTDIKGGGGKVDFWLLTDIPFDKSRFSRKCKEEIMGVETYVSSPEDTILSKLRWAKLSGGSEKQFVDALRVYEIQFGILDINYINYWVEKLEITQLWNHLLEEAEPI